MLDFFFISSGFSPFTFQRIPHVKYMKKGGGGGCKLGTCLNSAL